MEDITLLKLAMLFSVVGLISLYLFSEVVDVKQITISNIKSKNIGEDVRIIGIVDDIKNFEKTMIIDVKDDHGIISVVVFKDGKLEIEKGSKIDIWGEVKEYKGKLELIGEEVKIVQ